MTALLIERLFKGKILHEDDSMENVLTEPEVVIKLKAKSRMCITFQNNLRGSKCFLLGHQYWCD